MNTLLSATFLAGILIGVPLAAQVEEKKEAPDAKDGPPTAKIADRGTEPRISLQFRGGTLDGFVKQLKELADVNVVLDDEVRQATIPAVDLKNVTPESAFMLVQMISGPAEGSIRFERVGGSRASAPIYFLQSRLARTAGKRAEQPGRAVEVFSLRSVVDDPKGAGVETVLTAVQTALEQATEIGQAPAGIKFHPESGLLIIKGSAEQTGVAKQVLERMKDAREDHSAALRDQEVRKMEDMLRSARAEIDALHLKLTESQSEITRLRAMLDDARRAAALPAGAEKK